MIWRRKFSHAPCAAVRREQRMTLSLSIAPSKKVAVNLGGVFGRRLPGAVSLNDDPVEFLGSCRGRARRHRLLRSVEPILRGPETLQSGDVGRYHGIPPFWMTRRLSEQREFVDQGITEGGDPPVAAALSRPV